MLPIIKTNLGKAYHTDCLKFMKRMDPKSVDLIVTSPPYALTTKKEYGNVSEDEYVNWFHTFAKLFKRILKPSGSLVLNIGGAWKKGGERTTYQFEILRMFCKELKFKFIEDIYYWIPNRIPTAVVTTRPRLKDSVEALWWLSLSTTPKGDVKKVLAPYKDIDGIKTLSKRNNLRDEKYPGGQTVRRERLSKYRGGAIPSNFLAIPAVELNVHYIHYCKHHNLPIHPARFPITLPSFFIKFLTDENDLVFDPFGGSCTTGEASERLNRRWICTEQNKDYLLGARGRFEKITKSLSQEKSYTMFNPECFIDVSNGVPTPSFKINDWEKVL